MEQLTSQKTFKNYLYFWSGQLFSLLGSLVVQFVIIWWITIETQSVIFLSIAYFLFFLPQVFIVPIAGVFADRWNRKIIIGIADSLQAIVTFLLIFLFFIEITDYWLIILINTLRGVFQAFHLPTVNAIIPVMVPKDKLSRINGINFLFTGLIQIIGPIIAATFLAYFPINQILWIDIITYFIAIVPLSMIRIPSVKKKLEGAKKTSFKTDFKMGLIVVKTIPGLLSLMILAMFINFLIRPFNVLMPYYINVIHNGTASDLAVVLVFMQIGIILGSLITSLKKKWKNEVEIILVLTIILNIGYAILAFVPTGFFFLIGIGGCIFGFTISIIDSIYLTILQINVPTDKIGRVISIDHTVSMAITPIGAIISGPLAEIFGVNNLYLYCAFLGIIVVLIFWIFTDIKHLASEKKSELGKFIDNMDDVKT